MQLCVRMNSYIYVIGVKCMNGDYYECISILHECVWCVEKKQHRNMAMV